MKLEQSVTQEGFVDLLSYSKVKTNGRNSRGNILKSTEIQQSGSCAVTIEAGDTDKPSVLIHRNGDRIDQIEFVCQCGKATLVDFEYEGE